jgi:hypothetical protein
MDEKVFYGKEDCIHTGYDIPIAGKVVILRLSALPENLRSGINQLCLCTGGNGSNPNPIGRSVFTVSLADGEHVRWNRSDILGILKPELLPDRARLQLSQIRPVAGPTQQSESPAYCGYCFLPDGRYTSGVPLSDIQEVQAYIDIQREYQHRVMICDSEDNCVFEMIGGKVIFPTQETIELCRGEQSAPDAPEPGGMEMRP